MKNKPLVLLGMMGVGKSSVGHMLASRLDRKFLDMDTFIEHKEGRPIQEVFDAEGEAHFRAIESKLLKDVLRECNSLISTGGGIILNDENRELIKSHAVSVWIKADVDVLYNRLKDDDTRPLLRGESLKERIQDLVDKRSSLYAEADIHVTNNHDGDQAVKTVVDEIVAAYKAYALKSA